MFLMNFLQLISLLGLHSHLIDLRRTTTILESMPSILSQLVNLLLSLLLLLRKTNLLLFSLLGPLGIVPPTLC